MSPLKPTTSGHDRRMSIGVEGCGTTTVSTFTSPLEPSETQSIMIVPADALLLG